ncbi:MAG: RNA polymerase sigma factor [Gemmatimonadales bacterium]|nr:MAG: RNA polymerase sigma factor [Gemmatimonadales bacterium]
MDAVPSDAEIVADVLAGRTERFALLVERHEDALFRHALSLGMDPDGAADMVQDAMVRAWESLAECRDPTRFRLWVGRILRNRCLDHLKSASTRYTTSLDGANDGAFEATGIPTPELDTQERALHASLDEALAALPDDQSEAFVLKHVEGYGYGEIAELTGASVSALKMRVHRARDTIRALLEADGFGPT